MKEKNLLLKLHICYELVYQNLRGLNLCRVSNGKKLMILLNCFCRRSPATTNSVCLAYLCVNSVQSF